MRVVRDVLTGESQYNRSNQLSKIFEVVAQTVWSRYIFKYSYYSKCVSAIYFFVPDLGIWSSGRGV